MIKEIIKKTFLGKTLILLHDILYFPQQIWLSSIIKNNPNSVLVVGTSTYNNLGDHLIDQKEIEYLKDCFPSNKIIEMPTQAFKRNYHKYIKVLDKDSLVVITGGGWMGSLWPEDELRMQAMIQAFHNNRIIIFPQTIYYEENTDSKEILDNANRVYSNCQNLTLLLRECYSYEYALKHIKINKKNIYLMPDIALYGLTNTKSRDSKKLGICLRKDRENISDENIIKWLESWAKENKWSISSFSTVVKTSVPVWLRNHKLNKLKNKISTVEIVVTNRLHGMILAILCGCKCIALDNKTHKVSGVYNTWFKNNSNIQILPDNCSKYEIISLLQTMKNENCSNNILSQRMKIEFEKLNLIMKGDKNET